ncbi:MAG: hypothetical protein BWY92_01751 [Firmicutes bacterium ADurb.BinA052]|nr:MAG: hypothetical protein BWY92_01751 [Firmicutes bacterium ADurb.BinA052]
MQKKSRSSRAFIDWVLPAPESPVIMTNETSLPDMLTTFPAVPGGIELSVSTGDHLIPPCKSGIPGRSIFCVSLDRGFIRYSVCGAVRCYLCPMSSSLVTYAFAEAPFLFMSQHTPCFLRPIPGNISLSERPADQALPPARF